MLNFYTDIVGTTFLLFMVFVLTHILLYLRNVLHVVLFGKHISMIENILTIVVCIALAFYFVQGV